MLALDDGCYAWAADTFEGAEAKTGSGDKGSSSSS